MNLKKCLQVLQLQQAGSKSDVERAYHEMIETWRPNRFAAGSLLQNQAEDKIKEINIAYQTLTSFFSTQGGKDKLSRLQTPSPRDFKSHSRYKSAVSQATNPHANGNATAHAFRPLPRATSEMDGGKSLRPGTSGKYLWVGLIILLALASIFAIRYLTMLDKKSSQAQPQSSLLKRLTPETKTTNKAIPKKQGVTEPTGVMLPQNEKKPAAAPEVFEIHLKQGDIIRVQRWWQQGNMIMYTTKYGTMGVEKNAVEQIVSR
jgi:hypothetical protein